MFRLRNGRQMVSPSRWHLRLLPSSVVTSKCFVLLWKSGLRDSAMADWLPAMMLVTGDRYSCVSARKVRSHCRCRMALYFPMYSGQLTGYRDADFGGSVVTDGAYSTSGYVFQLAGAPVSRPTKVGISVSSQLTTAVSDAWYCVALT
jgi:hypothetical protein